MAAPLREKPLVEAIFEFRWRLRQNEQGLEVDANYGLLPGLFQQAMKADFPFTAKLPAAQVPAEMLNHTVQFQFRKAPEAWPLVQLGPGVLTVNDTEGYSWSGNFETLCHDAMTRFLGIYPNRVELSPLMCQLRYINGIYLDAASGALEALRVHLKTEISLPIGKVGDPLEGGGPTALGLNVTYGCHSPEGTLGVKFYRGKVRNRDALIWEIFVASKDDQVQTFLDTYAEWLTSAHKLAEQTFFTFLSDSALRRFHGDAR